MEYRGLRGTLSGDRGWRAKVSPTHSRHICIVDGRSRGGFLGQAISCWGRDYRAGGIRAGGVDPGKPRSEVADHRLPCFREGFDVSLRVYPVGTGWTLQVLRPRRLLPLDLSHRRLNPVDGSVKGGGGRTPTEEVRI